MTEPNPEVKTNHAQESYNRTCALLSDSLAAHGYSVHHGPVEAATAHWLADVAPIRFVLDAFVVAYQGDTARTASERAAMVSKLTDDVRAWLAEQETTDDR